MKKNQATGSQTLDDFNWDDDFFGIPNTSVKEEVEVVNLEKDEKNEDDDKDGKASKETEEDSKASKSSKESKEEDEDLDFFGGAPTEKATEVEEDEVEEEEEDETNQYLDLFSKGKEKGLFSVDLEEDEVLDEDKFFELQDKEVEARVEETFQGFFEELDDDAAAFLKFKKEGGDTKDFFSTYKEISEMPKGDIDDEVYQEKLSRYYLKTQDNLDPDDVDDRLQWLKDSGKLGKYAENYKEKLSKKEEANKARLLKEAAEQEKARKAQQREFEESVKEMVSSLEKAVSLPLTSKDKKELVPFITKHTVKVGKNQYITPMQEKLGKALKDPEKMLALAKLLNNGFDISDVVAKKSTEETRKVKKNLQNNKNITKKSSGKTGKSRGLADFF